VRIRNSYESKRVHVFHEFFTQVSAAKIKFHPLFSIKGVEFKVNYDIVIL
jgi:hypothetical protein